MNKRVIKRKKEKKKPLNRVQGTRVYRNSIYARRNSSVSSVARAAEWRGEREGTESGVGETQLSEFGRVLKANFPIGCTFG